MAFVITFVQTAELPYWREHTSRHTVLVVGMDEVAVLVLDPAMPPAHLSCHWAILCWRGMR
jgi:predicted double-glycine peptidase